MVIVILLRWNGNPNNPVKADFTSVDVDVYIGVTVVAFDLKM